MSWIDKILPSGVTKPEGQKRSSVPEGLWKKCLKCDAVLYRPDLERNNDVCPKCDHHMRVGARIADAVEDLDRLLVRLQHLVLIRRIDPRPRETG